MPCVACEKTDCRTTAIGALAFCDQCHKTLIGPKLPTGADARKPKQQTPYPAELHQIYPDGKAKQEKIDAMFVAAVELALSTRPTDAAEWVAQLPPVAPVAYIVCVKAAHKGALPGVEIDFVTERLGEVAQNFSGAFRDAATTNRNDQLIASFKETLRPQHRSLKTLELANFVVVLRDSFVETSYPKNAQEKHLVSAFITLLKQLPDGKLMYKRHDAKDSVSLSETMQKMSLEGGAPPNDVVTTWTVLSNAYRRAIDGTFYELAIVALKGDGSGPLAKALDYQPLRRTADLCFVTAISVIHRATTTNDDDDDSGVTEDAMKASAGLAFLMILKLPRQKYPDLDFDVLAQRIRMMVSSYSLFKRASNVGSFEDMTLFSHFQADLTHIYQDIDVGAVARLVDAIGKQHPDALAGGVDWESRSYGGPDWPERWESYRQQRPYDDERYEVRTALAALPKDLAALIDPSWYQYALASLSVDSPLSRALAKQ